MILLVGCGKEESGPATREKIIKTIHNAIGEKINGEEKIQSLSYKDKEVTTTIKQSTVTKGILLSNSKKLFERLYNYEDIEKIAIIWEGSFTDTYGNTEFKPVMVISLSKEVADKIKWDNFNYENLEELADEYKIHEQLK